MAASGQAVLIQALDANGVPQHVNSSNPLPTSAAAVVLPSDAYAKVQSANATDTAFPATIPTVTEPVASASRAVLTWAGRENLLLVFFGTGADNTTFDYLVVGWQKISTLWVPTHICQGSATLSAVVGVAAAAVLNTERFADTLDVDFGIAIVQNSPVADKTAASLETPIGPFDYVEICFDLTGATDANALWTSY